MNEAAAPRRSIRDRLGLHRPELRAWAMYDWANSAFATTIMAAVLPVYYHQVAAVDLPENLRTAYWGYTQTVALVIVAFLSPVLGAAADSLGAKKSFLRFFISFGFAGVWRSGSLHKGVGCLRPLLSLSGTSGSRQPTSSMSHCCLISRVRRRLTASRPPDMRWVMSVEGCCWRFNLHGSHPRRHSGSPMALWDHDWHS